MHDKAYTNDTFLEALKEEQEYRLSRHNPRIPWYAVRGNMIYEGPEIAPISLYLRWLPGRVTVANISTEDTGRGRMPVVFDALEQLTDELKVESVNNPHLRAWLKRRGYEVVHSPGMEGIAEIAGDMIKVIERPEPTSPAP